MPASLNAEHLSRRSHVAVVGGGFTGLACAFALLQAGYRVTVLEAQVQLGGLATSFDFGPFRWDKFYHCILTSDSALLGLLRSLDLEEELHWTATEVGFYSHNALYRMTTPRDLLRFPHLSLFHKLRLALGTVIAARRRDGDALEAVPLERWTRSIFGRRVYQEIWEPLLRCKLGDMRYQASAAFLWATLRRLYSTREKGPKKQEKLGYVHGGYRVVFERLCARVTELGGVLRTGVKIQSVQHRDNSAEIALDGLGLESYDAAILTVPNRAVAGLLQTADTAYLQRLRDVQYLGMVCVVLILRRRLSPFYVTNITQAAPFTGVIEMTNLIDPQMETAGRHLVYLPKYTVPDDPLFRGSDEDVWAAFAPTFFAMYPDLQAEDIERRFIFRERTVQPVPTLHYSRILPPAQTPLPRVFLANTSQIVNNTLNNNVMASIARSACQHLMAEVPVYRVRSSAEAITASRFESLDQLHPTSV